MKPSKPKAVWVERNKKPHSRIIKIYTFELGSPGHLILGMRYDEFKEMYGLSIRPGQCLKVEFKGRVVK